MHRRHFLHSTLGTLLSACSARMASDEQPATTLPRRFASAALVVEPSLFPQSVASGDPKPDSVVLWVRALETDKVFLQVAIDAQFESLLALGDTHAELELPLDSRFDGCVKVRLDSLASFTTYYYRFIIEDKAGNTHYCTRTGRTRTAPETSADAEVEFVVLSCQDFGGRYYHALRRASELEPDFAVHLGDYIYETTNDASFQTGSAERSITFRDVEGALPLLVERASGAQTVLAARSLSNYRQLYQEYRSDADLQALHERIPMIIVWDDHEFANDATQERAPSQAGLPDPERRRNADQAWFEYMPVDYPEKTNLDAEDAFPDNLRIYRDFRFGRHLHLVMTDERRYRAPHLVAEDELPGRVLADEQALSAAFETLPEVAQPYVDLDEYGDRSLAAALRESADAQAWGFDPAKLTGKQDIGYLNGLITLHNESSNDVRPLIAEQEAHGRGIAALHLGKTDPNSSFGARYFVVQEAFEALAYAKYVQSNGASESVLGADQRAWFVDTLSKSEATWKVWGNEYTFLRKLVDLRRLPGLDAALARRFLLSVEDWDGAPNERLALLSELADVSNLVVVTGDIHSFFVGSPGVAPTLDVANVATVTEFVCGAVSSATYDALLAGFTPIEGIGELAPLAPAILAASNPHVSYQNLGANGFALVRVSAAALQVTYHQLPAAKVYEPTLDGDLASHFTTEEFHLSAS